MKKTVYAVASWNKYSKAFDHTIHTWEPSADSESVLVATLEVEFETLGEQTLRQAIYNAMMAKRKTILADAYAEATELEAQANELLAIEFIPTKEAEDDIPF